MKEKYLSVTALTRYVKRKIELDPHLQEVWLKGEISNFSHHSRGHMYLTIKDTNARIQAVMFSSDNRQLKFRPENGMNVLLRGHVSVFEPYGNYQFYIKSMEPDGIGALYLAFEQLKVKLESEGYFELQHKRQIPKFPRHIGVITSPTGAAVRDIITTIKRRFPIVQLTVLPVLVQGGEAAPSIVKAIENACSLEMFDTLIIGRGGGSIEDLWSFNDERVVKAIFHSKIPIISAIGHETDVTISDFVADLRAATPTGAGELAVPSMQELSDTVHHLKARLIKLTQLTIMKKTESLQVLRKSYAFHYPKHLLSDKEQYVDRLTEKLQTSFSSIIKIKKTEYEHQLTRIKAQHPKKVQELAKGNLLKLKEDLHKYSEAIIEKKTQNLLSYIDKLSLLNPLYIMKRGFALPINEKGKIIKSVDQVAIKEHVEIKMQDGSVHCLVQNKRRDNIG
ncbi:exodeoxyribonuclease VII large subunit [Pseudogracilibacillus sp. SE30717A]|uniref:exodeoxyribonuclease VII large subunit n=1 Tax=Pseudogracilibacillus sp. SE30717A TaxID=3098293 RepID=UPI00300E3EAD